MSTTIAMQAVGAVLIADFFSGLVHWAEDAYARKDTPIIGDLIKSRSFEREETELVVMVTPYMVKPFADETQVAKAPVPQKSPLSQAFADNLRRTYANKRKLPEELMGKDQSFGYLMP